jgi:LacI family transcriptional regulator, repressor for deo operon, udp, cdd, tsx, nupC, and nupG
MPNPVSILDVARMAGVSTSTVSRSLRGKANVSQQTRERVFDAVRELEYVPSPAASRLASGRTSTVGIVAPFPARWFFSEVITGAEGVLREAGYDLLLYNVGDSPSRSHFFTFMPIRRRVDAVLVVATSCTDAERMALAGLDLPISAVGGRLPGFPRVGVDDENGAAMAVRHLLLLGHRDIAMISGDPDDPTGAATTRGRRAGFAAALRDAGLPVTPRHMVSAPWGVTGGARAAEHLLTQPWLPTAIFVESDEMALGALQALRKAGLNVPGNVSLIGFDDHEMAPVGDLTTIAQPACTQGEVAAQMLLDSMTGAAGAGDDVILPTRLVLRGSTGPPPRGRRRGSR